MPVGWSSELTGITSITGIVGTARLYIWDNQCDKEIEPLAVNVVYSLHGEKVGVSCNPFGVLVFLTADSRLSFGDIRFSALAKTVI